MVLHDEIGAKSRNYIDPKVALIKFRIINIRVLIS